MPDFMYDAVIYSDSLLCLQVIKKKRPASRSFTASRNLCGLLAYKVFVCASIGPLVTVALAKVNWPTSHEVLNIESSHAFRIYGQMECAVGNIFLSSLAAPIKYMYSSWDD